MKKHRRLQIDVINKYFYPVAAGIEIHTEKIYGHFLKKGWNVTMHVSKDTLDKRNVLKDEETYKGLIIKRYLYNWYGFLPRLNWDITTIISLHNFNIFPHLYVLVYALFLKILKRKKFVLIVTPHGFNPDWSIFPPLQSFLKRLYQYSLGTLLINVTADGVRAISEWEKRQMLSKGIRPSLITTISNGIEMEAYMDVEKGAHREIKAKVKKLGRYIIQVGRIHPIKNYETTIKALPSLSTDIKFLIVGPHQDEMYLMYLKKLSRELDVENRVIFLGVIRGIDKYYIMKHAALMVHMARWESFCNVVHEGLSQGLVCIVANNSALPYLIKNDVNGYCIETKNYQQLAEKINFVLENKNSIIVKEIQARNRKFALKNSWEKISQRVEKFYISLISQGQ